MNGPADWTMHHVGVAVADLAKAVEVHRKVFGHQLVAGPIEDPRQKVIASFLRGGEGPLTELVAPLGEEPAMDAFQWELGAFADSGRRGSPCREEGK